MPKDYRDESAGSHQVIIYTLPEDLSERMSEAERELFDSLAESQKRIFLKQSGHIPSDSLTATRGHSFARVGMNRQASKKDRTDALQGLILAILKEDREATTDEVLNALKKCEHQSVIERVFDEVIEWIDKNGRAQETQISALKYRISRARKKIRLL
jgi:hypothetical protein